MCKKNGVNLNTKPKGHAPQNWGAGGTVRCGQGLGFQVMGRVLGFSLGFGLKVLNPKLSPKPVSGAFLGCCWLMGLTLF